VESVRFVTNHLLAIAGRLEPRHEQSLRLENLMSGAIIVLDTSRHSWPFGNCRALSVSADTTTLAAMCSNGIVRAQRQTASDNDTKFMVINEPQAEAGHYSVSSAIDVSPKGDYLAAADNGGVVRVFGRSLQDEVFRMTLGANSLAFRPDGSSLTAGLRDGSIATWPLAHGTASIRLPLREMLSSLAWSPDERWLAGIGEEDRVHIVDVSDPKHAREIELPTIYRSRRQPLFSRDGRFLALRDQSGVQVIETRSWRQTAHYDLPSEGATIAYAPDGHTLVALDEHGIQRLGSTPTKVNLAHAASGLEKFVLSPDSRFAAGFIRRGGSGRGLTVTQVWDAHSGTELAWLEEGHRSSGSKASRPARGGRQELIAEAEKWRSADTLKSSQDGLWQLDLTSRSATAEIQEAGSRRPIARLEHDADLRDAAFSPRGRWLATSTDDGVTRLWPLHAPDLIEMACRMLPRHFAPDTEAGELVEKACPAGGK
jgi:WD40 repeat protein